MSHNSMHDPAAPHFDGVHHRRAAPKPKEDIKPLLTSEPLPHHREKKPAARPPKKRKTVIPSTPALAFHPKFNTVPSGKQVPPPSPSVYSRPSTSESSSSSQDEQQTTLFADREIHDQFYNGYDVQKRLRIFPECSSTEHSASFYPDTPCTDVNDVGSVPHDFYDSRASYASSSSPAPSDQSACAAETALHIDYARSGQHMYGYSSQEYEQQPVVHQDPYCYPIDRPAQNYPMQYPDAAYGRPVPHGIPAFPDSNDYPYPSRRN
ncbi:hypothetical protein EV363DRAFT_1256508 [Boletus edulis]|nr:hypothetical protein EV363DRAFT_1256508 [Boletus edulis]